MLKHILSCLGTYKKYAILAPMIISIEVCMEILMPLVMAKIIDNGIGNGDIHYVAKMGLLMIGMAFISLTAGVLAGRFAAVAGADCQKESARSFFIKYRSFPPQY